VPARSVSTPAPPPRPAGGRGRTKMQGAGPRPTCTSAAATAESTHTRIARRPTVVADQRRNRSMALSITPVGVQREAVAGPVQVSSSSAPSRWGCGPSSGGTGPRQPRRGLPSRHRRGGLVAVARNPKGGATTRRCGSPGGLVRRRGLEERPHPPETAVAGRTPPLGSGDLPPRVFARLGVSRCPGRGFSGRDRRSARLAPGVHVRGPPKRDPSASAADRSAEMERERSRATPALPDPRAINCVLGAEIDDSVRFRTYRILRAPSGRLSGRLRAPSGAFIRAA